MQSPSAVTHPSLVEASELARHLPPFVPPWVSTGLLELSGVGSLNRAYRELAAHPDRFANPFEACLATLGIELRVDERRLTEIPEQGPCIVVSNHPFGGADGLCLGAALLRRRADLRVITNAVLARIAELRAWFLDVEVLEPKGHLEANTRQVRAALRHLDSGGLLAIFPAGSVSHLSRDPGGVADPEWNRGVGMLARRSRATVVPCYFPGKNSPLFYVAGLFHPTFRTALLPRELLAKKNTVVTMKIGRRLTAHRLAGFANDQICTAWLRTSTYELGRVRREDKKGTPKQRLALAEDFEHIDRELRQLGDDSCLVELGPYRVYCAKRSMIPHTVSEIGRLRELTFRVVGEGTGRPTDLDEFDDSYQHLVLCDVKQRALAGAYRLAFCSDVMKHQGLDGLYTSRLFCYRPEMGEELDRAMELGRSFVSLEYQRNPLALALLWRGIGKLLCARPECRRLIGPASISDRFRGSARRLLLAYLERRCWDHDLSRWVRSKRPLRVQLTEAERQVLDGSCSTARELSRLLSDLDDEGKGIPVLLERYLALGAKVLGLSVDASFGNCIDALIVVDLEGTPAHVLDRFMGRHRSSCALARS